MSVDVSVDRDVRSSDVAMRLLHGLVDGLARGSFAMGEIAALRRLDPRNPDIRHLVPLFRVLAAVGIEDEYGTEDWPRIVLIANCLGLGLARGKHDKGLPAGVVLHEIGFSEQRLNCLLSADFDGLMDLLPRVARQAAASGLPMDWRPLVRLAWSADRDEVEADRQRRLIATSYVRASRRSGAQD